MIAEKIAATLTPWIPNGYKLMTLTLKASAAPLRAQLKHLRASFRRLRQQVIWTMNVKWGRAILEVTYNRSTKQWHPHIHVVARAGFIRQEYLALAWADASDGSMVVDIRIVKKAEDVAGYLKKYLGKMSATAEAVLPPGMAEELYLAVRNAKMVIPFGDPPALPPDSAIDNKEEDPKDWTWFSSLEALLALADKGDHDARVVLASLGRGPP